MASSFSGEADPRTIGLLAAVAVQFAVQPTLTKRCIAPGTATSSLVLGGEAAKILGCLVALSRRGGAVGRSALEGWTLRGCLLAAGLPSLTYLVQNYCVQVAYQRLDSVVFNVLNQTKAPFTALFSWLIVGRKQSGIQCLALGLVTLGGVLVSLAPAASAEAAARAAAAAGAPPPAAAPDGAGVACAVLGAGLSGLGSGVTEWALQKQNRDNFLLTMEIATLGCLALIAGLLCNVGADSERLWSEGLFARWGPLTAVPVASQGLAGILVGFVTKVAGGVRKVLATIVGLILTCLLQVAFSGRAPASATCAALPLVAGGIYLHAMYPPKRTMVSALKVV